MIRIVVVEDEYEHQQFFKAIINSCVDFKCIGLYALGKLAVKEIMVLKPDLVIMDLGLSDISGIECIRKLRADCDQIKFLVCSVFDHDEKVFEALKAGANSYFVKNSRPYQIRDAIYDVMRGDMPMSSNIATKILNHFLEKLEKSKKGVNSHQDELEKKLTEGELNVLRLMSRGLTNLRIGEQLNISLGTVKWTIRNIYKKLQAENKSDAILKFLGNA